MRFNLSLMFMLNNFIAANKIKTMNTTQKCIQCHKSIRGRCDKKFCSGSCKTEYNNRKYKNDTRVISIKKINNILIHNRDILKNLIEVENKNSVDPYTLTMQGFHFNFHTHVLYNNNGKTKYFCYDYGYQKRSSADILIFSLNSLP